MYRSVELFNEMWHCSSNIHIPVQENDSDVSSEPRASSDKPWTMEKLRAYISYVRKQFQPAMTESAAKLLELHYEKCRSVHKSTIPVTVRFLESMIRLSQAHARLMFHEQVELDDAVAVIQVMECTTFALGGFGSRMDEAEIFCIDPMGLDFSSRPDLDFGCFKVRALQHYGLQCDVSSAECIRLNRELTTECGGVEGLRLRSSGAEGYSPLWGTGGVDGDDPRAKRPRFE